MERLLAELEISLQENRLIRRRYLAQLGRSR
jgi:hypothetical protein